MKLHKIRWALPALLAILLTQSESLGLARSPGGSPVLSVSGAIPIPALQGAELERSVQCLALNIYHEARSESEDGQRAVAAVTLNRVASGEFPSSVCGVVEQGGRGRNRCQFSWHCDSRSDKPRDKVAWSHALSLSRKALSGEARDPTGGATYYHADYTHPVWSGGLQRTARIGRHIFYRRPST